MAEPIQHTVVLSGKIEDIIERAKAVERILVPLAVELWRLDKRLVKLEGARQDPAIQALFDQVRRIREILESAKVEIRDHTGASYADGTSLKVLAFEETKEIMPGQMRVLETVKPTILWTGQIIERGEVIVGIPPAQAR